MMSNSTDAPPYENGVHFGFSLSDGVAVWNMAVNLKDYFGFYTPDCNRVLIWYYDVETGIWLDREILGVVYFVKCILMSWMVFVVGG